MGYAYTILFLFISSILFTFWYLKRSNEVWRGTLIKKTYSTKENSKDISFVLLFKTSTQKEKMITTKDREYWDQWEIGDKAEKVLEEVYPRRV